MTVTKKAIPASFGHKASSVVYHDDHICPLMDEHTWSTLSLRREIRESDIVREISRKAEEAQEEQDNAMWYNKNRTIIEFQQRTDPTAKRVEYHGDYYTCYDGFGYVDIYLTGTCVYGPRD